MFTICISFPTLITKAQGMCEGASKQSPVLKNDTAPPVFIFLDPPKSAPLHSCVISIRGNEDLF